MTFDLKRVLENKSSFRQKCAAQPLAEKLRMLDALRERALLVRRATTAAPRSGTVSDAPAHYGTGSRKILDADTGEELRG